MARFEMVLLGRQCLHPSGVSRLPLSLTLTKPCGVKALPAGGGDVPGKEQSFGSLACRFARAHETLRHISSLYRGAGLLLVAGMLGLSGCASPEVKGLCPGYVHYSKEDDAGLLAELQGAARAGQPLPDAHRYLRDYGKQRAALRVICGGD